MFQRTFKTDSIHTFKYECLQLILFLFFLFLLYAQEIDALKYITQNDTAQQHTIQQFLNHLQLPFLPDCFFILFFPLLLLSISLIVLKKWRWFFLSLCGFLISTLLIADKIYYSFFTSVISAASFSAAGQITDIASSIFEAIKINDLLNMGVFIVFVFFGFRYNKKINSSLSKNKLAFTIDKMLGVVFFLTAIYAYNIAFYLPKRYVEIDIIDDHLTMQVSKTPIKSRTKGMYFIPNYETTYLDYAATFGLMNFHVQNLTNAVIQKINNIRLKKSPPNNIDNYFKRKETLNNITSPFYGLATGRNVFLLHFESLHPMLIGLHIGGVPITPTLNRLEQTSLYYENILDQVTIGGSSDSEFAAITGMLPCTTQMSSFMTSCMSNIPSIARSLNSKGYQTISLHGFKDKFYNRNINHPLLGFESMYFENSFKCDTKLGLGISDKDFFSQSVDLLLKHHPPFFAYFITLTSHYPYQGVPDDYQHLYINELEKNSLLIRYVQLIRYSDDALGEFFQKIKNSGLWQNSIFIIYGDHRPGTDESMNEKLKQLTGKSLLSPRFSCVPVMIIIPGQEEMIERYKSQYSDVVGGLYDIFPTIMHLLGNEAPFGVYGTHLFVENNQREAVPALRIPTGFVYDGILYRNFGNGMIQDDFGLVYTNKEDAVLNQLSVRYEKYQEAYLSIYFNNYIYEIDADIESLAPNHSLTN